MPSNNGVEGTLSSYASNPRAQLIQISAQYGASVVKMAPDFEFGVTDKSDAFTAKFPFGQVPAFECAAGCLNDTMAIASYVGGSTLRGDDELTRAQITQFMNMAENKLFPAACQVLYPCWGLLPNNKNVVAKGHEQLKCFMTSLNKFLESRTYLVGECVTLADLAAAVYMRDLYSMMFDEATRNTYVNVTRWFDTIMHQDEVVRILGETPLCVKPAQFDAKLFTQNNPKQKAAPKAAPKKETPKKDQPKKEEAASSEAPKQEKKPFADLPPTKWDMDTFKRHYWNDPTETVMKYFDDTFVEGEWSVWTCVYKYNKTLGKHTKCNNLCKGLIQRLETFRKFGFGIMYTFGDEPNLAIAGAWLGRGAKNFFQEDDNWNTDMENFDLKKLDLTNAEDKAQWSRFVAGNVDDWEGKPFNKDFYF